MWTYTIRVTPKPMRFRVEEIGNQLTITLRQQSSGLLLLVPLWGALILYLARDIWMPVLTHEQRGDFFIVLWTGFIVVWIAMAIWSGVKAVFGQRQLVFTPSEFGFVEEVLGMSLPRRWRLADLEQFQYVQPRRKGRSRQPGGVGFLNKGKLTCLRDDLMEAEVLQIIRVVRRWAATYAPSDGARL